MTWLQLGMIIGLSAATAWFLWDAVRLPTERGPALLAALICGSLASFAVWL